MQFTFLFARGSTMIDHEREPLLTMTQAAKIVPDRPHVATLWRWRRVGIAGVKLEVICVGGRQTRTSRAALARFFERVTAAKSGQQIQSHDNPRRQSEQRA